MNIDFNSQNESFRVSGIENPSRALLFSLKRIGYEIANGLYEIPINGKREGIVLQEIEAILKHHNLEYSWSETTAEVDLHYQKEKRDFETHSEQARLIRNNEFKNDKDLLHGFSIFTSFLNSKLNRKLYNLQLLSAYHMAFSRNACNFSVPGAGKTTIVYSAFSFLQNQEEIDTLLVLCPKAAFMAWESEYEILFNKDFSEKVLRINKDTKHRINKNDFEVCLINFEALEYCMKTLKTLLDAKNCMFIVDEAHRIKNPEGVWGGNVMELAPLSKARVILTGTPIPNGYGDLYQLIRFIYPNKFVDILKWNINSLRDLTKNPNTQEIERLKTNLSPYFVRIKKDNLKLPPISPVDKRSVNMSEEQREIYDYIFKKFKRNVLHLKTNTLDSLILKGGLIRVRQAATNPSLLLQPLEDLEDSDDTLEEVSSPTIDDEIIKQKIQNIQGKIPSKFKMVKEIIDEVLERSEKVIVWVAFVGNAYSFGDFLKASNIDNRIITGSVPLEEREEIITSFNDPNNQDFQVLIATLPVISESVSLHKGCNNAIYLERDYSCYKFIQSKDRIHRVGSEFNQVNYYVVNSENSIDETIDSILEEKEERMNKIINDDIPLFQSIDEDGGLIKRILQDYDKRNN